MSILERYTNWIDIKSRQVAFFFANKLKSSILFFFSSFLFASFWLDQPNKPVALTFKYLNQSKKKGLNWKLTYISS